MYLKNGKLIRADCLNIGDKIKTISGYKKITKINKVYDIPLTPCTTSGTLITDGNITSQNYPTLSWGTFLVPKKIMLLTMAPENLSLTDLYNYAKDLKSRGENPSQYVLVFWQKISIPLTAAGMILISIPFLLGSQRSTSVGHNMMIGVVVGVGFYLGAQITSHIGVLLEWNPALTALTPALILITLATGILRKTD